MEDERKQRMEERRARRKRQVLISRIIILVLVLIIAVFCVILVKYILDKKDKGNHNADVSTEQMQTEQNQTGISIDKITKAEMPLLFGLIAAFFVVAFIPAISLLLLGRI